MGRTGNDCWCLSSMTKILAIPWSLCSEPLIVYRFHVTDSIYCVDRGSRVFPSEYTLPPFPLKLLQDWEYLKTAIQKGKRKKVRHKLIPGLKICPWSIHIADDVSNVANDSCKYKDSKKKHESSENIFLQRTSVQPSIKNSTHESFVARNWCNSATVKYLRLSFRMLAL